MKIIINSSTHMRGATETHLVKQVLANTSNRFKRFFATNNVNNFLIQMIRNFNAPAQNKTNNRKTSSILAATAHQQKTLHKHRKHIWSEENPTQERILSSVVCPFKLSITIKIKRWLFPKSDGINEELTKHTRSNDQIKQTILLQ